MPNIRACAPKPRRKNEEEALQIAFFEWVEAVYPEYRPFVFHIPNGGARNPREGARLKRAGVTKGVLDVFFAHPNKYWSGLWIEFKSKKGKLTPEQEKFAGAMFSVNYEVYVCSDIDEAVDVFTSYVKDINR